MNKIIYRILFAILFSNLIIMGCQKDEARPNPTMSFITEEGYIFEDASFASGDTLLIGLECKWNGTDLLKNISSYANDQPIGSLSIDETNGQELQIATKLTKSQLETEKWDFELTDANGQKTMIAISLTKDQTGAAIESVTGIKLGTQNNTEFAGFYAISNGEIYFQSVALTNQTIIDFIAAYDTGNEMFLASPAANLDGIYDLTDWTIKNMTYYCATDMSTLQFDFIDSDALIIEAFDEDKQSEIVKQLSVDDVYVFKTQAAKYGIFKVTAVDNVSDGSFTIDIKVQP